MDHALDVCTQKFGITKETFFKKDEIEDDCFYKCCLQELGIMDEEGHVDIPKLISEIPDLTDDEEEQYHTCDEENKDDRCAAARCICKVNDD